jgi:hypothetical protein
MYIDICVCVVINVYSLPLTHILICIYAEVGKEAMQAWHNVNHKQYTALVPPHMPSITRYAVLGEVRFTSLCQRGFNDFYSSSSNRGAMFQWVRREAVVK